MTATRAKALSLYRSILRAARKWEGSDQEKIDIASEARDTFRQAKQLTAVQEIEDKLGYGEARLELGLHYHIPYERLHHKPQMQPQHRYAPQNPAGGEVPTSRRADVNAKLAAALERRKRSQRRLGNDD